MSLNEALGAAYHLHTEGNHAAAVAQIRLALDDRAAADVRLAELASAVKARTQGGRCHAHVEKVTHDLLEEAMRND